MMSHLKDYLDYYATTKKPGYAVLVTGAWGSGKTHQVKEALGEDSCYYVSLFGLQSVEDIHAAVLAQMDPQMSKVKAIFGGVGDVSNAFGGLGKVAGLAPKILNAVLIQDVKDDRIIVFDDFERCTVKLSDIIGAINVYVEHNGCCVVVIAHDEACVETFQGQKEKLIGQTLKIKPQVDEAFDAFAKGFFKDKKLRFIKTHKNTIIDIFNSSEVKSLRILKHVLEDIGRLYECLDEAHRNNSEAMKAVLLVFLAFNMKLRKGDICEENITKRSGSDLASKLDKFDPSALRNQILNDEVLGQMLINGHYAKTAIQASLNNSHYFMAAQDMPPWKIIWNFCDYSEYIVAKAITDMQAQFDQRSCDNLGEMLHIFCLRIMLSENSVLSENVETVVSECKLYMDDLLAENQLPPRKLNADWDGAFDHGYDGYGFWGLRGDRKAEVLELLTYLDAAREKALEDKLPQVGEDLLRLMTEDIKEFERLICTPKDNQDTYGRIPILSHIKPETFVKTWLDKPQENWDEIKRALSNRYKYNPFINGLENEKKWAHSVTEILETKASETDGMKAMRMRWMILDVMQPEKDGAEN